MVRSEHFLGQYGQLFRLFDVISSMSGVESDFFATVDRLVDRLGVSDNVWPFGVLDCDPFELLFGPVIDFIATLRFFDSGGDRESSCSVYMWYFDIHFILLCSGSEQRSFSETFTTFYKFIVTLIMVILMVGK